MEHFPRKEFILTVRKITKPAVLSIRTLIMHPRKGYPCNVDGGPGSSTEYIKFESFRTFSERSWDAITGVMVVTFINGLILH